MFRVIEECLLVVIGCNSYQKILRKNENKIFRISLRTNTVLFRMRIHFEKCQEERSIQLAG